MDCLVSAGIEVSDHPIFEVFAGGFCGRDPIRLLSDEDIYVQETRHLPSVGCHHPGFAAEFVAVFLAQRGFKVARRSALAG